MATIDEAIAKGELIPIATNPNLFPPQPGYPADPNPFLRTPLPPVTILQPDTLRQFYRWPIPQVRVNPFGTPPQVAKAVLQETIANTTASAAVAAVEAEFLMSLYAAPAVMNEVVPPCPVHTQCKFVAIQTFLDTASTTSPITVQVTRNGNPYGQPVTIQMNNLVSLAWAGPLPDLLAGDILNFNITKANFDGLNLTVKVQVIVPVIS